MPKTTKGTVLIGVPKAIAAGTATHRKMPGRCCNSKAVLEHQHNSTLHQFAEREVSTL